MNEASGIAVEVGFVPETTLNTVPTNPTLKRARLTSRNINGQKNILESAEVAGHAQVIENRHGFNRVEGTLAGELLTGGYDPFLASAVDSVWGTAVGINAASASVTAPATVSTASTNLKIGDFVRLAGFANINNNGVFQVVSIPNGTSITVAVPADRPLVSQSGGTLSMTGSRLLMQRPILSTFTIERAFPDVTQFELFTGVTMNGFTINATPEAIVPISFPVLGVQPRGFSATSVDANYATNYASFGTGYAAPATGSPYDAFSGSIIDNGVVVGAVTSIEMTVAANKSLQPIIGSRYSSGIYFGQRMTSGTMSLLFKDATFANKFINETTTKVALQFGDPNGVDYMGFYMPRVKINSHNVDPGQTGPIVAQAQFVALYDATALTSLAITRSNAA